MRQETVDIVGELVSRMQPTINIDSIIDNGNSTYTIITSNTSYVAPGTTLTIGSNEYVVLSDNSFVFNEQFTVSGSVNPSGTTEIILDVLHYKHGTAMATNSELSRIQLGIDKYPLVYLLEVIEDDFNNDENLRLDRTSDLRLFFLSETKEESWTTDQHYEYSIKPMRNMAYDFIKFLNKITLIGEFDTYKIFNYAKFGVYTPQKGSISRIFNDKLSGAELRINLPILKTNKCSNDKEISVVCESGKVTNSDETFIDFVMSGGTKVLPDTKVTDSDGQVYYHPSVNDVVCTPGGGTADVTNSDGTFNETVNAGDTLVVEDSEISINGDLLNSLPATNDLDIEVVNEDNSKVGAIVDLCDDPISYVDSVVFSAEPLTDATKWQIDEVNTTNSINIDGSGGLLIDESDLSLAKINIVTPYMVVIGDSISRGAPLLGGRLQTVGATSLWEPTLVSEEGQINYELSKLFNAPVINQGIGGNTTAQVRGRWGRDVLAGNIAIGDGRPNETLSFGGQKPRVVYLHCGINDSAFGVTPAQTKDNLDFFADSCLANNIELIISNIGAYSGLSVDRESKIVSVNNWIESDFKVNHPEVTVIDYFGWSTDFTYDYGNLKAGMFYDAVHPNKAGYTDYSQYIYNNCTPNIKLNRINLGYALDSVNPYTNFSRITEFILNGRYHNISGASSDSVSLSNLDSVDTPILEILVTETEEVTNIGILTQSTGLSSLSFEVVNAGICETTKKGVLVYDSEITNSDESVKFYLNAEGKLVVPDIEFTDSDGITRLVPAFTNIIAKSCSSGGGIITDNLNLFLNTWDSDSYAGSGADWYDLIAPKYDAIINGTTFDGVKKALTFNGTTDFATLDNSFVIDMDNAWTTTAICTPIDTTELFPAVYSLKLSTGGTMSLLVRSSGGGGVRVAANSSIWKITSATPLVSGQPIVIVIKFLGGVKTDLSNWQVKINNVDDTSTFNYPIGSYTSNNRIGGLSANVINFKGDIYGVYHRIGASTDVEDTDNYNYLKTLIPTLP